MRRARQGVQINILRAKMSGGIFEFTAVINGIRSLMLLSNTHFISFVHFLLL